MWSDDDDDDDDYDDDNDYEEDEDDKGNNKDENFITTTAMSTQTMSITKLTKRNRLTLVAIFLQLCLTEAPLPQFILPSLDSVYCGLESSNLMMMMTTTITKQPQQ